MAFSSTSSTLKNDFRTDVLRGLRSDKKFLLAKYFYDAAGDILFQKIMHCPEYYPTDCELEILREQSATILSHCLTPNKQLDMVELGAGDAFKSIFLLKELERQEGDFQYFPIDISKHVIADLEQKIPLRVKNVQVKGFAGEYLEMLASIRQTSSDRNKLVLFLGSSLGNMNFEEGIQFLKEVKSYLRPGDFFLLGLDLVKTPEIILNAYNDATGYTKAFNLNLLTRINRELGGNFKLGQFAHFPIYETKTKACKSYLISLLDQEVKIDGEIFHFDEKEQIYMEISQKYDEEGILEMLKATGFQFVHNFFDTKKWFVDTLWKVAEN